MIWSTALLAAMACAGPAATPAFATEAGPWPDAPPFCTTNLDTATTVCAATLEQLHARGSRSTTVLLARLYDGAGLTGSYWEIRRSAACDASSDVDYSVSSLPAGWNDRISSFQGANRCQLKLFEHIDFAGASTTRATALSALGDLDNRTSSIRMS